jgi:CubicO group peptidase (beta-lactamase class C family)
MNPGSDRTAVFGETTRDFIEAGFFSGAVIRIERDGRLLHEEAVGSALSTPSEKTPMEVFTIFDIASLTKLFTTTAVLRLLTQGAMDLSSKAGGLLEGFAGSGLRGDTGLRRAAGLRRALDGIDIRSLLSHSSGLLYWYPFYVRRGDSFEEILADLIRRYPPKGDVVYSDLNFMILGRIVERLTSLPLEEAVASLVCKPLGLERTSWKRPLGASAAGEFGNRIERAMVADLGLSFQGWRDESRPLVGEADDGNCHYFFGGVAGHAGIFSDARDLCRLGLLFLEDGLIDGRTWIEAGLVAEATRDQGGGRGLGFQFSENYPKGGCGHTGFTGTCLYLAPASGLAVVTLANRLHVPKPRDINPWRKAISEAALSTFA